MTDWWLSFYDDTFADFVFNQNPETTHEVKKLIQLLSLNDGDRVFDQCCGVGRLAIPLSNKGFDVVGVDVIQNYIERAKSSLSNAQFIVDDAFNFIVTPKCDAAFNWHTSFGYSLDDKRNKMMLQCAYDSLKKGGVFALDYPNMLVVLQDFKPLMKQIVKTEDAICTIERKSEIDLINGALKQDWVFSFENKKEVRRSGVTRLYLPYQLKGMFESVGFTDIQFFGDADNRLFETNSSRCIVRARKPR